VTENSENFKALASRNPCKKSLPWYKRCPTDWQQGTRRHAMTLELRGFYSECLDAMWQLQDQLPKDEKILAMMTGTNARMVRKLIPQLISLGKLIETASGYYNSRMIADISGGEFASNVGEFAPIEVDTRRPLEREPISNRSRTDAQSTTKIRNYPTITTREVESESDKKNQKEEITAAAPVQEPAALPGEKLDLKNLQTRLLEACNGSLDNPVNCLGLLSLSTPQMWLANGCDLELDVLPTLTAAGKKYHGKRIRDWGYFTGMIAEAKAKRTAGMPEVSAAAPVSKFEASSSRMSRIMAKIAADAGAAT
jgi:hypothetical protein